MNIRKLRFDEDYPMNLLLLADPSRKLVEDYIKRGECFVSDIENQIVGVYVLLPTRPGTVELVNIAVTEGMHGKGVGKQLVSHAVETARSRGYKTIETGTGNSGIGQLALYQKCGFRIVGVCPEFCVNPLEAQILT
ncbi:GNAT family N-acetyltransferase [Paenibacillus xerothermodurans]|uniref:GNAT family N-acetyltransferase n=1 Tax=Paenibacillus xerothermodurans TaxID=1977292 RepID=A0A2W1NC64_PAEXE|nr:GNAT family N-acetyltransferase [Paenibacillus xerothermodurans]PZE21544.1 GNAT family N-acetyltransferase [Paenibacillus xerothermodurans]